jgi:chemotaxis protein MotB
VSKRRHRPEPAEEHGGDERWLLTYADMITLLLALFIVLFSVSTINQKKFEALALGLKQTFDPKPGVLPSSNGLLSNASLTPTAGNAQSQERTIGQLVTTAKAAPSATTPAPNPITKAAEAAAALAAKNQQQLAQIQQRISTALIHSGLQGSVTSSLQKGQLTVQILDDNVFFATDSTDLGPAGDKIIDEVAAILAPAPNLIDVNGYTDNQAITGGPYTSNEELSAVRAVEVVLRLSQVDGVSAARLAATGFGDTHPAAPNTSAANMALNRRIDINVIALGGAQS